MDWSVATATVNTLALSLVDSAKFVVLSIVIDFRSGYQRTRQSDLRPCVSWVVTLFSKFTHFIAISSTQFRSRSNTEIFSPKSFSLKNVFILWSRSFSIAIFVLHVLALCFAHTNPFAVSVSSYHGISLVMNFPLFSQRSSLITSRTAVISYFLKTTEILLILH